jgi:hypothetical protein
MPSLEISLAGPNLPRGQHRPLDVHLPQTVGKKDGSDRGKGK